jgi:hypothetical protein
MRQLPPHGKAESRPGKEPCIEANGTKKKKKINNKKKKKKKKK